MGLHWVIEADHEVNFQASAQIPSARSKLSMDRQPDLNLRLNNVAAI